MKKNLSYRDKLLELASINAFSTGWKIMSYEIVEFTSKSFAMTFPINVPLSAFSGT